MSQAALCRLEDERLGRSPQISGGVPGGRGTSKRPAKHHAVTKTRKK